MIQMQKWTWGSPGGTVIQLVHPWRSSAEIRGRIFTATRTHCVVESAFLLPPFNSACSISGEFEFKTTAFVVVVGSVINDWSLLGFDLKIDFEFKKRESKKRERKGFEFWTEILKVDVVAFGLNWIWRNASHVRIQIQKWGHARITCSRRP
jgi:hypothetical protein